MLSGSQGSLQRSLSSENMILGLIVMFCLQRLKWSDRTFNGFLCIVTESFLYFSETIISFGIRLWTMHSCQSFYCLCLLAIQVRYQFIAFHSWLWIVLKALLEQMIEDLEYANFCSSRVRLQLDSDNLLWNMIVLGSHPMMFQKMIIESGISVSHITYNCAIHAQKQNGMFIS